MSGRRYPRQFRHAPTDSPAIDPAIAVREELTSRNCSIPGTVLDAFEARVLCYRNPWENISQTHRLQRRSSTFGSSSPKVQQSFGALRGRNNGPARIGAAGNNDGGLTDLPATCLRGLRKKNWIAEGEFVTTDAFLPDPRTSEKRPDGGSETSVNWEDDSSVEALTLADRATAEHGAARLPTSQVATASSGAPLSAPLACERSPKDGNQYHGNIVFPKGMTKIVRTQLAGALTVKSRLILRQPK